MCLCLFCGVLFGLFHLLSGQFVSLCLFYFFSHILRVFKKSSDKVEQVLCPITLTLSFLLFAVVS